MQLQHFETISVKLIFQSRDTVDIREEAKLMKCFQAYKNLDDIHFEPFVVENGGELGKKAQEIFKNICI